MRTDLKAGLTLEWYEDLVPVGAPAAEEDRYARVPWFDMMVWSKPGQAGGQG